MGSDRADSRAWISRRDFNPRSPDGERLQTMNFAGIDTSFQSTLPGWGATRLPRLHRRLPVFQSTLPGWGATFPNRSHLRMFHVFQSTLPGWGATPWISQRKPISPYFNPRSPDGERLVAWFNNKATHEISIHAPRMGSDRLTPRALCQAEISIHAPRMGSDRENGHLRPRYGQNHPFSTLIVSQIVVDVLGTVRKSQKHQRTSHYEVIKQPERQK